MKIGKVEYEETKENREKLMSIKYMDIPESEKIKLANEISPGRIIFSENGKIDEIIKGTIAT